MPKTGLSPDELRTRALDEALSQTRKHGFEKVRLSSVAKALGLGHAALYPYFRNKEALFDAVVQRWLEEIDQKVTATLITEQIAEAKIVDWFAARYREKRVGAVADPELYRAYNLAVAADQTSAARHWSRIAAQLTTLVQEAGLGAEREVNLLLDAMQAYNHPALITSHAAIDRTEDLKQLLELIITGLKTKGA